MAQNTKIIPTIAEREAALNTNFFDLKRDLTARIIEAMGVLGENLAKEIVTPALTAIGYPSGLSKISRGENFNGYPYIVLDSPRLLDSRSEVICRTIFWWGHSWSIHFALQGDALQRLQHQRPLSLNSHWQLYTGENIWEQAPSARESTLLHQLDDYHWQQLRLKPFFKIYHSIPLTDANEWPPFGLEQYQQVFQLIT